MNRNRTNSLVFGCSLLLCYLLQLMPLPYGLAVFKPFWLALVLIYWALEAPERVNLGLAFLLGLFADVLIGDLLGEHALRLCILCFIVLRFRPRLRFFPMWQQSLAVLALLVNDHVLLWVIRAFAGEPLPAYTSWFSPLVGMLAWPWVFLLLDDLRARQRASEP